MPRRAARRRPPAGTRACPARGRPGRGRQAGGLAGWADGKLNWHRTAYGITVDHPYRYTRIGYSVAVWPLSAGGHGRLLPILLVLVNLLGVAAMAWLAALLVSYAVFTNEPLLVVPVVLALTRLWQMFPGRARPGLADLAWAVPGSLYVLLQGIQHVVVRGRAGGAACRPT